ncbi:MAG: ABC transporter substrate-binding protein [Bacillota bacterium]
MKINIWIKFYLFFILIGLLIPAIKAEPEPVTIAEWDWFFASDKYLTNEIKLFEQKYPYIKVNRTRQVQPRYKVLVDLAKRSDTLPDILALPMDLQLDWMRNGYLMPLDQWADKKFRSRFPKGSFLNGVNMSGGKIYSFPQTGTDWWCQLYINNKIFKDAGLFSGGRPRIPKTWTEIIKFSRIIVKKGKGKVYGFGLSYQPEHLHADYFYEWAKLAGARAGNQEMYMAVDYKVGRYNFTSSPEIEGYLKMFRFLLDLKKEHLLYPNSMSIDDETLRAAFADGKIGMIMGGVWNQAGWQATHPDFTDYECVMIPPFDPSGYKALLTVPIAKSSYAISSSSKHPEEAWKFLDFLATPESGARFVQAGIGISIFPSANVIANARTRQYGQYLEIGAKYTLSGPSPLARNPELSNVKMKAVMPNHIGVFWGVLSEQIKYENIPDALKELEDRLNAALKEGMDEAIKKGYKVSMDDLHFPDWDPLKSYEQN